MANTFEIKIYNEDGTYEVETYGYTVSEVREVEEVVETATRADLIREAGKLNNHPKLVNTDHVTFMGFMDTVEECARHVAKLRSMIAA